MRKGIALVACAVVAQSAFEALHFLGVDSRSLFDANDDRSLGAFASAGAAACAAAGLLVLFTVGRRWITLLLAAALVVLAVDDVAAVHETAARAVTQWSRIDAPDDWTAPFLLGPLLVFVVLGLWFAPWPERRSAGTVRAGVAVLAAAVAYRIAGGLVLLLSSVDPGRRAREGAALAQQDLELAGWLLVALGVVLAVRGSVRRARSRAQLRPPSDQSKAAAALQGQTASSVASPAPGIPRVGLDAGH